MRRKLTDLQHRRIQGGKLVEQGYDNDEIVASVGNPTKQCRRLRPFDRPALAASCRQTRRRNSLAQTETRSNTKVRHQATHKTQTPSQKRRDQVRPCQRHLDKSPRPTINQGSIRRIILQSTNLSHPSQDRLFAEKTGQAVEKIFATSRRTSRARNTNHQRKQKSPLKLPQTY